MDGEIQTIEIPEKFQSFTRDLNVIDIDEKGTATISTTNWITGAAVGPFRKGYSEVLPEDRRRHYLEMIEGVSMSAVAVSDLVTDTHSYPSVLSFSVRAPDYAVMDGKTMTLWIPGIGGGLFELRGDKRENPLFFGGHFTATSECIIILPKGYTKLPLLPAARGWELPCGLGTFTSDITTTTRPDGRLQIRILEQQKRQSGEVPAQLYPALLEYNRLLAHPSARTLVAEKESK
jgi:hypothetical protein